MFLYYLRIRRSWSRVSTACSVCNSAVSEPDIAQPQRRSEARAQAALATARSAVSEVVELEGERGEGGCRDPVRRGRSVRAEVGEGLVNFSAKSLSAGRRGVVKTEGAEGM
eukprot:1619560-Pleurochrysis_carterae.AAC.2